MKQDPEQGITFTLDRYSHFVAGSATLLGLLGTYYVNDEFLYFTSETLGENMMAQAVYAPYLPEAINIVNGIEKIDYANGGVTSSEKAVLEDHGWILDEGRWMFYLSCLQDRFK